VNPLGNTRHTLALAALAREVVVSAYNDLMALARLCLRQASTARTSVAADELQRLATEYQDRAAAIKEGPSLPSNAPAASPVAQQQQQSQGGFEPPSSASVDSPGERDDAQFWRERAEGLRARAAQLTDGGGRLVMLQIAETYEALARRAEGRAAGSVTERED
jgi:hypothetical protein